VQQHQQASQPGGSQHNSDTGGHSQASESDVKEHKPRRERRERSRRDKSSRQSLQQNSDSSRDETSNASSNDGSKLHSGQQQQQQQTTHRVIVDPNSFQRQILQPNPNGGGGVTTSGGDRKLAMTGGSNRGMGELYDEDSRGSDSGKQSSRRQVPAGRTVYSWQGTSSNQQQQQQQQQQMQQQQQQTLRGPAGPYSQPGFKDPRSMGVAYSAGGGGVLSAGGRPTQNLPIAAIPPAMGSQSVKLMNENGKFMESAEQWLSDHPGHFTVGILGTQGSGKSSLLSSFCPVPLASSAFSKQPPQMASVAGYQTSGIDMYITPERMILLDTEPIFCLSNLENALRNERVSDGVPLDLWLDHQALTMATFLVSVCNVVLVMTDERSSGGSSRILKLLQRVEVFMRALSASSSSTASNQNSSTGMNAGMAGQHLQQQQQLAMVGQDGSPREGLGDWCADIILVSNKVPTMQFTVDYYRKQALEQSLVFQYSTLQLFGSINMAAIYPRFENAFKKGVMATADNTSSAETKRLSGLLPSGGAESSISNSDAVQDKEKSKSKEEPQQQQLQQQQLLEISMDDRKTARHLNLVLLPFDSTITAKASSSTLSATAAHAGMSQIANSGAPTILSSPSSLLQFTMSNLSISFNREDMLGASSFKNPSQDTFGTLVQDQERWRVWTKGLRNKVLSLSMRPQGGPALGPRNRPGMVSEREWLRYASWSWDTIRKADFLNEYIRATKLSLVG
ncbi:smg-9, nonsense mediated mRNA decay factor, partial [Mortierella claussenii]